MEKFKPAENFKYEKGWDKFALDYIRLPHENAIYRLTKNILYKYISINCVLNEKSSVLDLGCGTGNDFPYFLNKGAHITGLDLSGGMLNKAFEKYKKAIEKGHIDLQLGYLQELNKKSFSSRFDLIFSVTGGLAYVDEKEMERLFVVFKSFLKPHGKIITAHFNKFCLTESLFYALKFNFRMACLRFKDIINVAIKDEVMTMYLQTAPHLKRLVSKHFKNIKMYPLLVFTPPYQTGYTPKTLLKLHSKLESFSTGFSYLSKIADQTVMVISGE